MILLIGLLRITMWCVGETSVGETSVGETSVGDYT
jgi:hypothetical protein